MPVDAFLSVHYPYDRMSVDPIGGTFIAIAENKSERIEVRTTPNMKALIQRAAASSHKNVTEFLLEAGINAAEDALVDRRIFRLDDHQWQAFQAILDRRWCMNRNWPATILTQRLLTYRYRTTLARQGPSSDLGCCMRAAPRPFALLACALEGQCR